MAFNEHLIAVDCEAPRISQGKPTKAIFFEKLEVTRGVISRFGCRCKELSLGLNGQIGICYNPSFGATHPQESKFLYLLVLSVIENEGSPRAVN